MNSKTNNKRKTHPFEETDHIQHEDKRFKVSEESHGETQLVEHSSPLSTSTSEYCRKDRQFRPRKTQVAVKETVNAFFLSNDIEKIFGPFSEPVNSAFEEEKDDEEYVEGTHTVPCPEGGHLNCDNERDDDEDEHLEWIINLSSSSYSSSERSEEEPETDEPSDHKACEFIYALSYVQGALFPSYEICSCSNYDENRLPADWEERSELLGDEEDEDQEESPFCLCDEDEDVEEDIRSKKERLETLLDTLPNISIKEHWGCKLWGSKKGAAKKVGIDPIERCHHMLDVFFGLFQTTGGCNFSHLDPKTNEVPKNISRPFCAKLACFLDHLHSTPIVGIERNPDAWAWLMLSLLYESYFSTPLIGGTDGRVLVPFFDFAGYMSDPKNGVVFWSACMEKNLVIPVLLKVMEEWMLSNHKKSCPKQMHTHKNIVVNSETKDIAI